MAKKYYYCPKCKEYPEKVQTQETVFTLREWDGENYQGYDTEYEADYIAVYCIECEGELIEKIQK